MHRLFLRLAASATAQEDFPTAVPCDRDGVRSLVLRSSVRRATQALEIEHGSPERPAFVWSNLPEDWEDCALKLEPLLEHDEPGHQYLMTGGAADTLVVLGYRG